MESADEERLVKIKAGLKRVLEKHPNNQMAKDFAWVVKLLENKKEN
jgi:hypothetical protein